MASPVPHGAGNSTPVQVRPLDDILVLELAADASFENLRTCIRELLGDEHALSRGKDARLDLDTRNIDLFDLRRLVHLLGDECDITVTGIYCTDDALQRYAERELKLKIYARNQVQPETETETQPELPLPAAEAPDVPGLDSAASNEVDVEFEDEDTDTVPISFDAPVSSPSSVLDNAESPTRQLLTVTRSLRSGQLVRCSGDVAIYGDVHPGAEVIAGGNVMIFGTLMGMAHAGSRGDESATVLALNFRPTQLRIGRKIGVSPENSGTPNPREWVPEIAWVEGGEVRIDAYTGTLPN